MRELLKRMPRGRDFHDVRGMEVILVPHCALNQNARVAGAAERTAAVMELIAGLLERGIGIIQMPCPELCILGLDIGPTSIFAANWRSLQAGRNAAVWLRNWCARSWSTKSAESGSSASWERTAPPPAG
jgi:hypothetical protein